jgi:hypothetical protein
VATDYSLQIAKHIARRATLLGWFDEPAERCVVNGLSLTGVAIKSAESYIFQPADVDPLISSAVSRLDAEAVMSISSDALVSLIDTIPLTQRSLVSDETGARIPIVPTLEDVTPEMCHYSRACIALEERVVLVWSQDPKTIVNVTNNVQREILDIVSANPSCPRPAIETDSRPTGTNPPAGRARPQARTRSFRLYPAQLEHCACCFSCRRPWRSQ